MEAFRRAQEELNREQAREREAAAASAVAAASAPSRPPTVSNAETVAIMERANNPRSNARAAAANENDGDDDEGDGDAPMSKKAQKAARRAELLQNIDNNAPTSDEFRRKAGKRAKVLYKQFQEQNMERIKSENLGMKRTQLLNVMWAEWQQNPQNPFLQRKEALNAEQQHAEQTWMEASDSDGDDG